MNGDGAGKGLGEGVAGRDRDDAVAVVGSVRVGGVDVAWAGVFVGVSTAGGFRGEGMVDGVIASGFAMGDRSNGVMGGDEVEGTYESVVGGLGVDEGGPVAGLGMWLCCAGGGG